tara:strand:+ start:496 stop:909 length:414 start_codon:yes stop_codon:yes gene_type:complete
VKFKILFLVTLLIVSNRLSAESVAEKFSIEPEEMRVIEFEVGYSDLNASNHSKLDEHVKFLKKFPSIVLHIKGVASETESNGISSISLAADRTTVVSNYLIENGVSHTQLVYSASVNDFKLSNKGSNEKQSIVKLKY